MMPAYKSEGRYGLHYYEIKKVRRVGFQGKPLTEEGEAWNREQRHAEYHAERHNEFVQKLFELLDDRVFVADSLNMMTSMITGQHECCIPHPEPNYGSLDETSPITETTRKNVSDRITDANLTYLTDLRTLQMLNSAVLSRNLELMEREPPEEDTPEILYRVFNPGLNTRHDAKLGFRSSRQPLTLPSSAHRSSNLVTSSLVDEKSLWNHCEGSQPSDLIALSDSPSRIVKIVKGWNFRERGGCIAIINVSKLLAMGVLFNRTTTLAQSLGVRLLKDHSDGLHFANANYWVAYRWIPAECIESYCSISSLQESCERCGIGQDNHNARFSLDDLLYLSSVAGLQGLTLGQ